VEGEGDGERDEWKEGIGLLWLRSGSGSGLLGHGCSCALLFEERRRNTPFCYGVRLLGQAGAH